MGCAIQAYERHLKNLDSPAARPSVFIASRIARASYAIAGAGMNGSLRQFVTKVKTCPPSFPLCLLCRVSARSGDEWCGSRLLTASSQGDGLPVAEPRRIALQPQDFIFHGWRAPVPVALKIYEGREMEMSKETMVECCAMTWAGDGVGRLDRAFRSSSDSVELVVLCTSHVVSFEVRINGEVLDTMGLGVDCEMPDAV
jgi:hypothetical protein